MDIIITISSTDIMIIILETQSNSSQLSWYNCSFMYYKNNTTTGHEEDEDEDDGHHEPFRHSFANG